jgi:MFS family permease
MERWRHAWPGLFATLNGVGLCRFAYTPLVPFLIAAGVVSATEAAYLGASNLAGYLAGAAIAAPLAARIGLGLAIRLSFLASILGIGAAILPGGFWWYLPWRFLAGGAGAVLMVLAPAYLLSEVDPGERGRIGGVIYTGVGAGIALSSLLVPPLAGQGLAWAWGALALGALVTALLTWPRWRWRATIVPPSGRRRRFGLPVLLVMMAFGMDGVGFIPHMLFWVDYVARTLGLGVAAGSAQWLLLGLGATFGPALSGAIGDRLGLGRALVLAFAVKAMAVLLPALATATPWLAVSSLAAGALTPGIAALSAARLTELVPAMDQTRAWGQATLVFGAFQALGAYGMAFAYSQWHSYLPLYIAGAGFELLGVACASAALLLAGTGRRPAQNRAF